MRRAMVLPLVLLGAVLLPLVGCGSPAPATTPSLVAVPSPIRTTPPEPRMAGAPALPEATATPADVLTGLTTPWSLAFLPSGAALITLRNPGQVLLLSDTGLATIAGAGADELAASTVHGGEGGLLGVAVSPDFANDGLIYLYRSAADGNQVVRGELDSLSATLGVLELVIGGIPMASNHNGGRLAFGPDGMLYVTTGDAATTARAQDPASLGGKILRITPDGAPAPGNPTAGSPVWTLGHRNVQGLGWDPGGRMFASEFGQNTWDELNLITPGSNYGWPGVEGVGGGEGLTDPLTTWSTSEASPSGIAVTERGVYLAALRGQRLWWVPFSGDGVGEPTALLVGELGRLRDVVVGPDGALWILTHNTDGRGDPRAGDDRLVRMLPPA